MHSRSIFLEASFNSYIHYISSLEFVLFFWTISCFYVFLDCCLPFPMASCILHSIRCNLLNYCWVGFTSISQGTVVWDYLKIFVISDYVSRSFNSNLIMIPTSCKWRYLCFRLLSALANFLLICLTRSPPETQVVSNYRRKDVQVDSVEYLLKRYPKRNSKL